MLSTDQQRFSTFVGKNVIKTYTDIIYSSKGASHMTKNTWHGGGRGGVPTGLISTVFVETVESTD